MRILFLLPIALLFLGFQPSDASAQGYYDPVPAPRYPICDSVMDSRGVRSCTGNPDRQLTRERCGWDCPEDSPDVYNRLGRGTLNLLCGDGLGQGCSGAYFTRNDEPHFGRCIYRVVPDSVAVAPEEERFTVRLSQLRHQGRIDLVLPSDSSHARYGRRYGRQMEIERNNRREPPPGYYPGRWRNPCGQ